MELAGICDVCGKAGKVFSCGLCGKRVCGRCYMQEKGVCIHCAKGRKDPSGAMNG